MLEVSVVFNAVRCGVVSTMQMSNLYSDHLFASTMKSLKQVARLFS